jgi:hypothetical protein
MADDTSPPFPSAAGGGSGRGGRPPGNRDAGGFRIRLSDNEMQAARALQEAFGLRSTVAVLGFALRALAQQLEQGQLEELLAQHRAQAGGRTPGSRGEDRRREGPAQERGGGGGRVQRIDPFARPSRPAPAPAAREITEAGAEANPDHESPITRDADQIPIPEEIEPVVLPDNDAVIVAEEAAEGATAELDPA